MRKLCQKEEFLNNIEILNFSKKIRKRIFHRIFLGIFQGIFHLGSQ